VATGRAIAAVSVDPQQRGRHHRFLAQRERPVPARKRTAWTTLALESGSRRRDRNGEQ